ncbi:PD-(D/E)XK nuclease family protein [Vagococcus xieshaowenii]|uniref:ATP-dependent helicase n=1 Tax=Vagococcus xieshaowenii TaxID=2562451 RepID=A0AAJ5EF83_9ENTE|nr:PD-(D/E)XK nuclease family protein [Vagococcus xieshaowenii]QCA28528.1 ATP-dependent helicase [Vagococcus xieshaowenii]TFZ42719.1 ATP-dependent helicase [Vagococcus xieshaowenii]
MSVRFFYGTASAHHDEVLIEEAKKWLGENKHHRVFYLVPNHVKFETEVNVLAQMRHETNEETVGTMSLQVFSLSRLAWYFLQNTQYYQSNSLSKTGKHMVLKTILTEEMEELTVYRGEVHQTGFVEQISAFIDELTQANLQADDLSIIKDRLNKNQVDLQLKLHDIQRIYRRYQEYLLENKIEENLLLSNLSEFLTTKDLSETLFIVSGFTRFTSQEQQLIQTLMKSAGKIWFDLVLNQAAVDKMPEPHSLFYDSGKLYHQLYHLARQANIPVEFDKIITNQRNQDLALIDDFWVQSQQSYGKPVKRQLTSPDSLHIWKAENPQAEVEHIGREIRRLVAEEGIRYKDIEILYRDETNYSPRFSPVFNALDIPFYFDESQTMKHHPLVELLDSLFAIDQRYFRYQDIMRFLRTELFLPNGNSFETLDKWLAERLSYRESIDVTENVMLAYGYEGSHWTREEDWHYINYLNEEGQEETRDQTIERVSNDVRRHVRETLVPFYEELNQASLGKDAAVCLYQFLVAIGVEQQMLVWRDYYLSQGKLEEAKIHEQSWQAFIHLLEEYVEILGDRPFDKEEFVSLLMFGLEDFEYGKVPTTLDQVKISVLDKVHAKKNKVTFIIGATDQVLPAKLENTTMLSDDERLLIGEQLSEEQFLLPSNSQNISKEPFVAYLAFLSTEERLYLTYPLSGEKGTVGKVSPYVARLSQGLDIEPIEKGLMPASELFSLDYIGTDETFIEMSVRLHRQALDLNTSLASGWRQLHEHLLKNGAPAITNRYRNVMKSLTHRNIPQELKPVTVDALYGDTLYGSVSRIEKFYQCEYKYFMTYGLRLKEREVFDLTPATAGELFHEALDLIFKALILQKKTLSELTEAEILVISESVLSQLFDERKYMILSASSRMHYIKYQLSQTIKRVTWALKRQSMRTGMSIFKTEVLFGEIAKEKGYKSLTVDLDDQKQMKISGKIDRLDRFVDHKTGQTYLSVVDYKSSEHRFNFEDAYVGLAMQMITYLDVALQNAVSLVGQEEVKPGGAFYLHIQNPRLKSPIKVDELDEKMLTEFKYKGLILEDEALLDGLDLSLEPMTSSAVYDIKQKKNGQLSSAQTLEQEEFQALIKHNKTLFKEAGDKIYAGKVDLNPAYRKKIRIACGHCPFRSVCQFDPMLKENNYRRLETMKKDEVIQRLKIDQEEAE